MSPTWFPSILALLLVASCADGQTPPPEGTLPTDRAELNTQEIEEVAQTAYTGITEPRRTVIRTEAGWREFWSELVANMQPPPEPPSIDFDGRMVIVAAMGARPTGGHTIEIVNVYESGSRLAVEVVETSPGPTCMTTQAFTAPVTAVAVDKRPEEPEFVERKEVRECS